MPRVSIWLPEELHRAAKELDLPISELTQQAVSAEINRRRKLDLLEAYLRELDAELGPSTPETEAEADAWIEGIKAARAARAKAQAARRTR
jgi:hypothetical protein